MMNKKLASTFAVAAIATSGVAFSPSPARAETYPSYTFKNFEGVFFYNQSDPMSHSVKITMSSDNGRQILKGSLKSSSFNSDGAKVICRAAYLRNQKIFKYGPWRTVAKVTRAGQSDNIWCATNARDVAGATGVRVESKVVNSYTTYRLRSYRYSHI